MSRVGTLDGLQFARGRGEVSGAIGIADLPRLAAMGCDAATLAYCVRGGESGGGHPSLTIEIGGELRLVCQRCLGPFAFPLAARAELELAESEREIEPADDDVDRVLATKAMDVAALVEDEVILALPMVAVHERCEMDVARGEVGLARGATGRTAPFAALAGRRRRRGPGDSSP
jgi:uncharacterized protein